MKKIAVVTPGFSADCLETLEEIACENREIFKHAWRREFRLHPVPQRQRGGMDVIRDVAQRELKGWV